MGRDVQGTRERPIGVTTLERCHESEGDPPTKQRGSVVTRVKAILQSNAPERCHQSGCCCKSPLRLRSGSGRIVPPASRVPIHIIIVEVVKHALDDVTVNSAVVEFVFAEHGILMQPLQDELHADRFFLHRVVGFGHEFIDQ